MPAADGHFGHSGDKEILTTTADDRQFMTSYDRVVQPFGYGGPHSFHPWRGGPVCNIGRYHGDI